MIAVIPSFVSNSEAAMLTSMAESADETSWWNKNDGSWCGKRLSLDLQMLAQIRNRLNAMFDGHSRIGPLTAIQRFLQGQDMGPHRDDSGGSDISYGCIIYLNENYLGGEIHYPNHQIRIKPRTGMLIVHSADENHLVTTIDSGTRYMLTTFIFSGSHGGIRFINGNT